MSSFTVVFLIAAILDGLVFLGCWLPGWLGYVGSEAYEWTSLKVGVISGVIGIVLVIAVIISLLFSKPPSRTGI